MSSWTFLWRQSNSSVLILSLFSKTITSFTEGKGEREGWGKERGKMMGGIGRREKTERERGGGRDGRR